MYERFTDRARKVMQLANHEAQRFNHEYIGTEHMLLGLIKEGSGVAANVLKNLDIDLRKVRLEVEKIVQTGPGGAQIILGKAPHTPRAKKVIEYAVEEARGLNHNYVGTEHLLLGLLREQEGVAAQVLMNLGLKLEDVREEVLNLLGHNVLEPASPSNPDEVADGTPEPPHKGAKRRPKTPTLDTFGRDLTDLAWQGKLGTLVGRRTELRLLFEVLGCRDGRAGLLVGEPGVGKSTLAAGLARAIVDHAAPDWLRDRRVVEVLVSRLWDDQSDGTKVWQRVEAIVTEARRVGGICLVFPHAFAPRWTGGNATWTRFVQAELLRAVSRSRCPCILTATPVDYAYRVEQWGSLGPEIQPIFVRPASVEESLAVLAGVRERYESHHGVRVDGPALPAIVDWADRRLRGALPGKAVQLLDRCAARARLRAWESSPGPDLAVVELDEQIERLNVEKEQAVADQDFEKGAARRDQADKLKKERDRLAAERRGPDAIVTAELVEEVARDLAGPA